MLEEENNPYIKRLEQELSKSKENIKYAKERLSSNPLGKEEIYGKIGEAISKSPITEKMPNQKGKSVKDLFPSPPNSPAEDYTPVLERIPVDESRDIEIRTRPGTKGAFQIAATKKETQLQPRYSWESADEPPRLPIEIKKDIATLDLDDSGKVSFVKSSLAGAKENALERVMMEASKRGMPPHSSSLLGPGSNMVGRVKKQFEEMPKEKYLQKIQSFLDTGKVGKYWSKVGPYLGPAAGVLGAALSPSADAAVTDIVIPGGLGGLGVSSEQAELDRRYKERVRQLSQRKK